MKIKMLLHTFGLSINLGAALWVLWCFLDITVNGRTSGREPNTVILAMELCAFAYGATYATYLLVNFLRRN